MKVRTTLEDLNNHGCPVQPCELPRVCSRGRFFHPLPQDNLNLVKQELPDRSYNQLSLNDMSVFSQLKGMDRLHKADTIADLYKRGVNLSTRVGKSDFLQHYK